MYPNNDSPRPSQEEDTNAQADTVSTQNASDRTDNSQTEVNDNEALATRTPERWWLRKRLMQS
jgi:hypothetical protein